MKSDERHPRARHQLDHVVPTVMHHPEEEMPVLARWVKHAMENPTRFWGTIGTAVLALLGISILGSMMSGRRAASDQAWTKLETVKTAAERVEIAKDFPDSPAGRWALLQAATEYYNQGFADLPANRDVALPTLKKSLDLFSKVAASAPADSAQARAATLGAARTLEARNELDKAIKQYEEIASKKAWAGTEEARTAERLATLLKRPEAAAFYNELYTYKRVETTLPPGGIGNLNLLPPSIQSPLGTSLDMLTVPPPPGAEPKSDLTLPADVFAPLPAPATQPEKKEETPK
jgi:hypothetical protein